ncbi:neuropeptide Y receptor type 1 [Phodopus roborovskii]|uniref:Gm50457 protein n=1 Tax=Phodopus roborovskii TaxID=109678 RepID=A0AAV0A048_PHORO|nr:neuropeptide Y receptor type 1 [Phodopus roborovskii]CAH7019506.1 Gm50457 [Phodopus roborovskii]
MKPSADLFEIIACAVLILVSFIGNICLFYSTSKCISGGLQTSFLLIISLVFVHLIKNLVVNVLKIVYSSGILLDSVGCKVLHFTAALTTSLAIWFMLHFALFYLRKLYQIVYPLSRAANVTQQKYSLKGISALWVAGVAVYIPVLVYTRKQEHPHSGNDTGSLSTNRIYMECLTGFGNEQVELYYGKIFLVLIDILPLAILVFVCFWMALLLLEKKKMTYGDIWIGDDDSETEVLRGAKFSILLMLLITPLWVSHFILVCCLKKLAVCVFFPAVLTALSSGFSALSPFLLMLVNYKMKVVSLCGVKQEKSTPQPADVILSPYA